MKKFLLVILVLVFATGLVGCAGLDNNSEVSTYHENHESFSSTDSFSHESLSVPSDTSIVSDYTSNETDTPVASTPTITSESETIKPSITNEPTTNSTPNEQIIPSEPGTTPDETPETSPPTENSKPENKYIVFWGHTGNKVHIKPDCRTIKNGVLSGTLDECKAAGHTEGWCGVCSKSWTDEEFFAKGNPHA